MLVLHLIIAIAIILLVIIKLRFSPIFGLIFGSLYFGIAAGLGALNTVSLIADGFGSTMRGIGLTVGFGVIIGQLLADSGAVNSIVNTIISKFSRKRTPEALCATSLVVSTPVFFDVGFIILTPIAKKLGAVTKQNLALALSPLIIGLGTAHMLIPPTPGPMVVADTLGVPLGQMILGGIIVGVPAAFLAMYIYNYIAARPGFWKEEDEEAIVVPQAEYGDTLEKLPPFGLSMLPVAVPVVLIVLASVLPLVMPAGTTVNFFKFIGDRNMAMMLGALCSLYVGYKFMSRDRMAQSVDKALASAGIVLLVTGAGGSLGSVLGASGIGTVVADKMIAYQIPAVLLAWIIASAIKIAQGSGTVAIITAANLMAPVAAQLGISGLWLALAIGSGALLGCHVNDSGFWVVAKIAGLTTKGGFKTYTLATAINAVTTLVLVSIFMLFLFK